jgi:hypothetical protein
LHLHSCVHIVCTIFILLPLSLPPPPSYQCQAHSLLTLPRQNLFCPPVLQFCGRKTKR